MTLNKDKTEIKDKDLDTMYEKNILSGSDNWKWACGCSITVPHSHLIAGYQCECEKGRPKQNE